MLIRNFSAADFAAIMSIQSSTPQLAQWAEADYAGLAENPMGLLLVAELDAPAAPQIVGFAAFHRVIDEAEVRNMAVHPAFRRVGAGRQLLAEGLRRLLKDAVKTIYLEVRASNLPAQRLYASSGFRLHSRRRGYYDRPREDALVLVKMLQRGT